MGFSKMIVLLVVIFGVALVAKQVFANPDEIYRKSERAKMDELMKAGRPETKISITNRSTATPAQLAFVYYFISEVDPLSDKMEELEFRLTSLQLSLDKALYNDDEEKNAWEDKYNAVEAELNSIKYGDELKNVTKRWAELSQGLEGELPDLARRAWSEMEIGAYDSAYIPLANKAAEFSLTIKKASKESEFAKNLSDVAEQIEVIKAKYKEDKISIAEAARLVDEQRLRGEKGQSRDIAVKARDALNGFAIASTQLAQSKKFKNWAEYQVAVQAPPYAQEFNTVQGRIKYLEKLLADSDELLTRVLRHMATKAGMSTKDLTQAHLEILQPNIDDIGKFFPKEKIDELWVNSLLDSGFSQADIDHINRDIFPRKNKETHAYMTELTTRTPKVATIDATKLDYETPAKDSFEGWFRANIFIVQNFLSDSIDAIRTAYHEGGHGIHFTHEVNPLKREHAYGYIEIHSMTQELFLLDKTYLKRIAATREGVKPTDEEIDSYISNAIVNDFLAFRYIAARALFELKLWNFEYTEKSESFIDRAVKLYGEVITQGLGVPGSENHGVDFTGRGPFNAPHFRSGEVRYIGYVLAGIAGYATHDALIGKLEKETGRRTLDSQPTIAKHLIDGYYHDGVHTPFPKSVEKFTGVPFSYAPYIGFFKQGIDKMLDMCESNIEKISTPR